MKKLWPDIEAIVITGYGAPRNAREAVNYGAGNFISKSLDVINNIAIVSKTFG